MNDNIAEENAVNSSDNNKEVAEKSEKADEVSETEENVTTDEKSDEKDDTSSEGDENVKDEKDELIEKLKAQIADNDEKYKRLDAEYYNYRNRSIKEKEEAYNKATAKAIEEILSVTDNFERALNTKTSDETYKKGVEMIYTQFCDVMKKMGVEEIEAEGKPFDPNFHHAVNQIEDENLGENTVAKVFQKGYTLSGKVIRPAMVCVANP